MQNESPVTNIQHCVQRQSLAFQFARVGISTRRRSRYFLSEVRIMLSGELGCVLLKVCPLVDLRRPRGPLDRYHRRRALSARRRSPDTPTARKHTGGGGEILRLVRCCCEIQFRRKQN